MKTVKLYLNYAGYCYATEKMAIRGGRNQPIKFYALFGLIRHPEKGWILFDTGYTRRFYATTSSFPNSLYAYLTKVVISEEEEVWFQLKKHGISTGDIRHIIISHFHADHIGGLCDFDQAVFYCSRAAWKQVKTIPDFWGFRKGILKKLLPGDFESRVRFIEDTGKPGNDPIFGTTYDLFSDETLLIFQLPGHAAGQVGLLLQTSNRKFFLISDSCWLKQSYQNLVLPDTLTKLFFDSWKAYKQSLKKIHQFHKEFPETIIVPSHCLDTISKLVSQNLLNEL